MSKMKLKALNFDRRNLERLVVDLEVPYSDPLKAFLREYSPKCPEDFQLLTKPKKNSKRLRAVVFISRSSRKSILDLEELLKVIPGSDSETVVPLFQVSFNYSTKRYKTDPTLPILYPLKTDEKDTVSLTGVKLKFDGKKSGLMFSVIDLQYCVSCGNYHTIGNTIVMKENIPLNESFLIATVTKASEYSKAFIKRKGDLE